MPPRTQLGDLQLAIMRILWSNGAATVNDVHHALLAERGLAPTTIATMLKKMESKGIVQHRTKGRTFIYVATVSEHEVTRSMVAQLSDRLFGGDTTAFVSHLISEHEIDENELAQLRKLVSAADKERKQ
jgi:BlaI family penicillinase repressor